MKSKNVIVGLRVQDKLLGRAGVVIDPARTQFGVSPTNPALDKDGDVWVQVAGIEGPRCFSFRDLRRAK